MTFRLAVTVFADELDVVSYTVNGHVACHGKRLENIHFLIIDSESSGTVHFTEDRNFVVGHTYSDNRYFFEIRTKLFTDKVLGCIF